MTVLSILLLTSLGQPADDGPAAKYEIVSPKGDGIIATGINERGDVVGFEWRDDPEHPGVVDQVPFVAFGKRMLTLPKLDGYTATFPAGISDAGLVVGRASKPGPLGLRIPLRNQAFFWDETGGIRGLGALPDDWSSFASGVSRDGRRIGGYSVGDNRIRACVWDRRGDDWVGTPLPHAGRLGSLVVAISGDGRHVAAVDGAAPCLWTRGEDGTWDREVLGPDGAFTPRAVNDEGTVVGVRPTPEGHIRAVVRPRGEACRDIEMPEGYARSEALDVNNEGVVVGMIDGPAGSEIGPRGFAWKQGRLRLLDEGGPNFVTAAAINDRGQIAGHLDSEGEPAEPKPAAVTKPDP